MGGHEGSMGVAMVLNVSVVVSIHFYWCFNGDTIVHHDWQQHTDQHHPTGCWGLMFWPMKHGLIWLWLIHRAVVSEKRAFSLIPCRYHWYHHVPKMVSDYQIDSGGAKWCFFHQPDLCCPEPYMAAGHGTELTVHCRHVLRMEPDIHASHSWWKAVSLHWNALKPWLSNSVVDVSHSWCSSHCGEFHDISSAHISIWKLNAFSAYKS